MNTEEDSLLKAVWVRLTRIETRLVKYQEQNMLEAALLKESLQEIVRLAEERSTDDGS
jgi:hypothetical protein